MVILVYSSSEVPFVTTVGYVPGISYHLKKTILKNASISPLLIVAFVVVVVDIWSPPQRVGVCC